jgi:hypothetical protein
MEGIPEHDLREHEKRLSGKDKDEPDSTDTVKVPPPSGMPPIPPLGMMTAPPMMPMTFTGMPFGMTPMSFPMMSVPMMTQLRPPMSMMPPTATNHNTLLSSNSIIAAGPTSTKPLFPSGATEVFFLNESYRTLFVDIISNLDK